MNRTDVQGTLREMWETRPARPHDDRQVAGVAAAVARRYDIDPVLVRIGFVVAAFSGIGAALYVAGWIALPDGPPDPAARQERSPRGILVVGLAIAAAISIGTLFDGNDDGGLLTGIAVVALLFLLHRSRGGRGAVRPGAAPTTHTAEAPEPTATVPSLVKDPATPVPPAWDPLGAAPFAWDLPEPSPMPPAAPPPRRLPVTPVTLGTALLAGGITSVVLLASEALTLANVPLLFGVLLAVIGSGLVIGAFVRAGRGLIPIALLLGVMTWGAVAAPLDRWQADGVGELTAAPLSVAQIQPSYQRTAGDITLDLRQVDFALAPGGNGSPVRTKLEMGAGQVQVLLPADSDVTVAASVGLGEATYRDGGDVRNESGPNSRLDIRDDLGADGVVSGRPLVLDIELGAGDVEVRRG